MQVQRLRHDVVAVNRKPPYSCFPGSLKIQKVFDDQRDLRPPSTFFSPWETLYGKCSDGGVTVLIVHVRIWEVWVTHEQKSVKTFRELSVMSLFLSSGTHVACGTFLSPVCILIF